MTSDFHATLHALRVWDGPLPAFDAAAAPTEPLPLFREWFVHAARAGQPEPHTMSLATVDSGGRPDVRTLMLHDADDRGWHFATHATSAKGRQLAAHPDAALGFYWPAVARQVRIRGRVTACGPEESRADLAVRSRGALAAALTGRQSEVLGSAEELAEASAAAWERAGAEPDAPAPTWTRYVLDAAEVEFFQGDPARRHTRLRYVRTPGADAAWTRQLLWP
ncbi:MULTISPECIES: pyridoxal 5'-phosphate synthase [unclassified Streptomyces]|uniref:pyridoxine/pyridoxamine 5'-phosphate oxidase n=1 Tax=unclassified Streptomyces TaxID=2593676 RepID=UPI00225899CC|nr:MULTISPECIES: pyridoxal 5'-phosphate synthase [unclassified Streptomyces]MCX4526434.1 pyridoxal 5'-phosphate synthase [Streptomyces sp. NBC_01551]MCX4543003.1 pyridoxal 5'-phosphate synthase [Streptomyces sp. NBC_01565]